jgi:hypothetical protein
MIRNIPVLCLFSALFATSICCFSQEKNAAKEKIAESISQYFDLDRESIHAHFDKDIFFSNESVWFKGYVYNKKNGTPFFETTNVYAVLYSDKGVRLDEQLIFCYDGTFMGNFKLGKAFDSGRYYIQFYTNWMNNFAEDESSVYPIDIISQDSGTFVNYISAQPASAKIMIHPEGGSFIEGVVNNIGIQIGDCNGNPLDVKEGQIIDGKGQVVKNFLVNKSGFAKVYLTPSRETYKAVINIAGTNVEAPLPKAETNGIAIEANNYAIPGKTLIKVRTNAKTLATIPEKALHIVIQQNNKSNIFSIIIPEPTFEKELLIPNDNLYPGTNTIRIIDSNMNQWAERIIFEQPPYQSDLSVSLLGKTGDTISVSGKINIENANISVSVLPSRTAYKDAAFDLYASALINPYLKEPIKNTAYYINQSTKAKKYELDLALLNQPSSKYDWKDVQAGIPKKTYDFDIGLSIKGSLNKTIPDPKKYRIQLVSWPLLINEYSEIGDNNEFWFKNLVIADSSKVNLTLLKMPSIPVDMTFNHQITNRKRSFKHPFGTRTGCSGISERLAVDDIPQFSGDVIMLDELKITGKAPRDILKYGKDFGNANLRGIKISPANANTTVLNFLNMHGFYAGTSGGQVFVYSGQRGRLSPEIYITGRQLLSFEELQGMVMDDIDEIYLNPHAIVPSMQGRAGIIKIYRKQNGDRNMKDPKKSILIADGFSKIETFENPLLTSTAGAGFEKYGAIDWMPMVLTDSQGNFKFNFIDSNQDAVKIVIEGIAPDGKMFSETKFLTVN